MGCFYCDEHHEGREAIMYKVGEMEAGVLYLFKDQAHKGRCALALKNHRKELCECGPGGAGRLRPGSGPGLRCSEGTVGLRQDQPGLLRRYESPPALPYRTQIRGRIRVRRFLCHHESGAGAALRGRISRDDRRPAGKAGDVSLPALTGLLADPSCLLNTFPLFCAAAL